MDKGSANPFRRTLDNTDVDDDEKAMIAVVGPSGGLDLFYADTDGVQETESMLALYPSEARDLLRLLIERFPLDALSQV